MTGANNHPDQLETVLFQGICTVKTVAARLLWQFMHQANVSIDNSIKTLGLECT